MKLLSSTPFDITEYCGNLIVTYLSDDKQDVQPLLAFLKENGYAYVENEVGLQAIIKSAYLTNMHALLDNCGCYILFVSENLELPQNRVLRNSIFYQIGYLNSRRQDKDIVIPYLKNKSCMKVLKDSPIHNDSGDSTFDSIMRALGADDDRFRTLKKHNTFYADDRLNRLTQNRIAYRRLIVSMDITEEDFKAAYDKYRSTVNELSKTEQEFINDLHTNMSCGARILSFGTEDKLTTHLFPYAEEQKCLDTVEFPTTFSCSHVYKDDNDKRDNIKGVYTLEYILPIHKLLGVNFKLFVQAKEDTELDVEVLEILFQSNFQDKHDKKVNGNNLYFSLDFPNAEPFPFDHSLGIGTIADFLYPQ